MKMCMPDGSLFDLNDPKPWSIDIRRDLAVPLSELHRWPGRVIRAPLTDRRFYSVAEHCVRGATAILNDGFSATTALEFMLHDAAEAVIGNIPAPVRRFLFSQQIGLDQVGDVDRLENRVLVAICQSLGVVFPWTRADIVQEYDARMARSERDFLLARPLERWDPAIESVRRIGLREQWISTWSPDWAADRYHAVLEGLLIDAEREKARR